MRTRHDGWGPRWVLMLGGVAVLTMVAAAGCSKSSKSNSASTSTTAAPTTTAAKAVNQGAVVNVSEYAFTAASVTVKAGQAVVWHNEGNVAHTVTETSAHDFNSPDISPGQTYVQTFDKPGTYTYICSIHPDRMRGTIVVTAASP